ncbi:MAG: STAS domain-containing protein [Desulfuromonadales bacterium]|nr:STAS domain-containing protein [Desulfuromonadales bacterium]
MEISCRKEGAATILSLGGEMDAVTAPDYENSFNELITAGEKHFIVDLSGLSYISSAGLRVILTTAKTLKGAEGQVLFANIEGTVKEVFDMSGFSSIFQICDSIETALGEIG